MKKLWKGLRIFGKSALALAALGLVVYAILYWITSSRLEARLQELRDAGEPLSLRELLRKPIPPEENAATYLRRARADVTAVLEELVPIQDKEDDQRTEADNKIVRTALKAYPKMFLLLE